MYFIYETGSKNVQEIRLWWRWVSDLGGFQNFLGKESRATCTLPSSKHEFKHSLKLVSRSLFLPYWKIFRCFVWKVGVCSCNLNVIHKRDLLMNPHWNDQGIKQDIENWDQLCTNSWTETMNWGWTEDLLLLLKIQEGTNCFLCWSKSCDSAISIFSTFYNVEMRI